MGKIAIVTDSTAYLPNDLADSLGISVVPLSVNFGTETYREGVDITTDQFYQQIASVKDLPTTSQPSVGDFAQVFDRLLQTHDQIIAVLLSARLSGTLSSAESAARMVGGDITVIDSKITSFGLERMAVEAAEMANAGRAKEEIISRIHYIINNMHEYFVVDDLDHLRRGGRMTGLQATLGSLLQIKPILTVDDGAIGLFEKVRTHRKALDRIVELFGIEYKKGTPLVSAVIHTQAYQAATELKQRIDSEFPGTSAAIRELGPVIGTHVGPGIQALIFYPY